MIGPAILSLHERANSRKDMADTYEKDRAFSLEKDLPQSIKWKRASCQSG
jgi:hypothetical protein